MGPIGNSTSALAAAGGPPAVATNESWNGTNWTELADVNTARNQLAAAGADNTSGLIFGGTDVPNVCEAWNGTAWAEVNNLNTQRDNFTGSGTQPAAIAMGGRTPPGARTNVTELWNGAAWTEQNDLNTARQIMGDNGTTTSALGYGGNPPFLSLTEEWNGSSIATKVLTD